MKKTSTIVMALALLMAMTQCKKNESTVDANNTGETFNIMLEVGNDDGSRVIVNPALGTVNFEEGDKIYVGSGGKYVGMLTHDGNHHFVGNITNPTEGQPLHFYFLGNVTPNETLDIGTTETCSVVISNQTEHLPVISYAPSNENYSSSAYAYTAHLLNKCALVKFNVTTPSVTPICITGMKNKVTVDFTQNTMTPSKDGEGVIMLPAGSGENVEKWAILLPQEALEEGEEGSAYSEDGIFIGTRPAISTIADNGYFPQGMSIEVSNAVGSGIINGLFTINASGDQVYFSKGNLQYIGSANTPYYKFSDNQYDMYGGANMSSSDIDLLSTRYQYNWSDIVIVNGGNESGIWYVLGTDEWIYLTMQRATSSGISSTLAKVNNVDGLLVPPDDWDADLYPLSVNLSSSESNVISLDDWNTILEPAGVLFLPSAGGIRDYNGNWGYWAGPGCYWASDSYYHDPASQKCIIFRDGVNALVYTGNARVHNRFSVRLVKNYNP